MQGDVDAREEGFVEGFDAVRREEEDAAVVFHMSEAVREIGLVKRKETKKKEEALQHGDHSIPLKVM